MQKNLKRHLLLLSTILILAFGVFLATYTAPSIAPDVHPREVAFDPENTPNFSPEGFILEAARAVIHALVPVR